MSANKIVADQHAVIGNTAAGGDIHFERTTHPGAKWFFAPFTEISISLGA